MSNVPKSGPTPLAAVGRVSKSVPVIAWIGRHHAHRIGNRHHSVRARSGPPRDPAPPEPPSPRIGPWPLIVTFLLIGGLVLLSLLSPDLGDRPDDLTFTEWRKRVDADEVETATIDDQGGVTGELTDGSEYTSRIPVALPDEQLADDLEDHGVAVTATTTTGGFWAGLLGFLPFVVLIGLYLWFARRIGRRMSGGLMGFGSSKAKVYDEYRPTTRFADVAGYEGAKKEIAEVVDFLTSPERYRAAGATGPRGVLMVGPPGTGKTLLARAVAGEAGVPFFALTGSSIVEMFVGVGAARVRDLFEAARKRAPAIVFIDEIDAIGQRRGGTLVANDEREQTLNQLLAELDGFDNDTNIVVLSATNRPETLDPALLRPGRFDRHVEIPLPNLVERRSILDVHVRKKHLGDDVDLDVVARATPGFSGADLANLVNEAAILAVRDDRTRIQASDLDEARDRIVLGRREATNALLPTEQHTVALHESGHALVAALCEHADPVVKVTILPAGQALGATEQLPLEERHLYPQSYLEDALTVRMGGRAAERVLLGEISTGGSNDLESATQMAQRMIRDYGMSTRLGPVALGSGAPMYLGTEEVRSRSYSETTQSVIDEEVAALLRRAEERAISLLDAHRPALERLTAELLAHETVDGDVVMAALAGELEDDVVLERPA